jgi:hypothetical protein
VPVPTNDAFEAFLSQCVVTRAQPESCGLLLAEPRRVASTGRSTSPLFLCYPDMELKLDSVLSTIERTLTAAGHPASRRIAVSVLGLLTETREPCTPAVAHANDCMRRLQDAELTIAVVTPAKFGASQPHALGDYAIRAFNPEQMMYWSKRCKSEFGIDLRTLGGRAAVERSRRGVRLIEWTGVGGLARVARKWGEDDVKEGFLDAYYYSVAVHHADGIESAIKDHLLLMEAAGLAWIDVDSFLSVQNSVFVGLFQWRSTSGVAGWAVQSDQAAVHLELPPQSEVEANRQWLRSTLGFSAWSPDSSLDFSAATYCRFLQRARGHKVDGRPDESFLQFAIALDLLLGEEGKSSDSVASRAALLVHRQHGATLTDETRLLRRLYGVRSKYVHEGRLPSDADLTEIERVCAEVLWALLTTSGAGVLRTSETWLRRIDFLEAALNASVPVSEAQFEEVGVPRLGSRSAPPHPLVVSGPNSRFTPRAWGPCPRRAR